MISSDPAGMQLQPGMTFQSPFLEVLPLEIRMMIYDLLLQSDDTHTSTFTPVKHILPDAPAYHDYEASKNGPSLTVTRIPSLKIRTEEPLSYEVRRPQHRRTSYIVRSDRFRARCMKTTYHLLNHPQLHTTIMMANARIHAEAADTLYSNHIFDFDTHVEAIIPFFNDLTPYARTRVRSIRLVKRALPYEKEFDRAEWSAAIAYIAREVPIRSLSLGIVAGKPKPTGWDTVPQYTEMDFRYLKDMDGMEWVQDLLGIRGLEELDVFAVVEHCPPPMSNAMARYIKFSASVDGPFARFLEDAMIPCK